MVWSEWPEESQEFAIRRHLWPNYANAVSGSFSAFAQREGGAHFFTPLSSLLP